MPKLSSRIFILMSSFLFLISMPILAKQNMQVITLTDLHCKIILPKTSIRAAKEVGKTVIYKIHTTLALQITFRQQKIHPPIFAKLTERMITMAKKNVKYTVLSKTRIANGYRIIIQKKDGKKIVKTVTYMMLFENAMYRLQFSSKTNNVDLVLLDKIASSLKEVK